MSKPSFYQIQVRDHLDPSWSEWFEGLIITHDLNGETIMRGPVRDQAVLFGLLMKLRDLSLTLISVNRVEPEQIRSDSRDFEENS